MSGILSLNSAVNSHASDGDEASYRFKKEDKRYKLPDRLTEISGLSYLGDKRIACVQDEKGNLYDFDLRDREASKICDFGKDGDYEGVEIVQGTAYVLRSDGALFIISKPGTKEEEVVKRKGDFPAGLEFEGLGYDPFRQALLLVTKSYKETAGSKYDDEGTRLVFTYDPATETFGPVLFEIEVDKLRSLLKKKDRERTKVVCRPSALAVHPLSGDIYVLSSVGTSLFVFSSEGEPIQLYDLSRELFRQPEGICFDKDGDMYISNEGRKKSAYILRFEFLREDN